MISGGLLLTLCGFGVLLLSQLTILTELLKVSSVCDIWKTMTDFAPFYARIYLFCALTEGDGKLKTLLILTMRTLSAQNVSSL